MPELELFIPLFSSAMPMPKPESSILPFLSIVPVLWSSTSTFNVLMPGFWLSALPFSISVSDPGLCALPSTVFGSGLSCLLHRLYLL